MLYIEYDCLVTYICEFSSFVDKLCDPHRIMHQRNCLWATLPYLLWHCSLLASASCLNNSLAYIPWTI